MAMLLTARSRRYQPLLLLLRYTCVAALVLCGLLLLLIGRGLSGLDKSPDAIAAERVWFAILGLVVLGTAIVLAWLNGPAVRWLAWAALNVVLTPIVIVAELSTEHEGTFHRISDSLYDGLTFLVFALVFAALCYPASRLGRQRLRWGSAWLVGWGAVVLGLVAGGLVWNSTQANNPNRDGMLATSLIMLVLAMGCLLTLWLLVRGTQPVQQV